MLHIYKVNIGMTAKFDPQILVLYVLTDWCSSVTGSTWMFSFVIFILGGGSEITVLATQRTVGGCSRIDGLLEVSFGFISRQGFVLKA